MHLPKRTLVIFLAVLTFSKLQTPNIGFADDTSDLKAVVDKFYQSIAERKIDDHIALWSSTARDIEAQRKSVQALIDANTGIQVRRVTVLRQKVDNNRASLQVFSDMTATSAKTGAPSNDFGQRISNFDCVKEDNNWKVVRVGDAQIDLINGLIAAKTAQERQALLDQEKAIVGPDLVMRMNLTSDALSRRGKIEDAFKVNDVASEIAATLGDKAQQGFCWMYRGLVFAANQQHADAIENYERALPLFREAKERSGEALTLNNLGTAQHQIGKPADAVKSFEASLEISRSLGNKSIESLTLNNLGTTQQQLKNLDAALASFDASAKISRESGNKLNESRAVINIGNIQRSQKKLAEALASYQTALKLKRDLGDKTGEADVLMGIGAIYHEQGDTKKATESFQTALQIVKDLKNKQLEGLTLNNIGALQDQLGDSAAAAAAYDASAKAYQEAGDKAGEARALVSLGNSQRRAKKPSDAMGSYQKALILVRDLKDRPNEANILMGIGAIQHEQGNAKTAADTFKEALDIVRGLNNKPIEAATLSSLGALYEQMKDTSAALSAYEESGRVYGEAKDKAGQAQSLVKTGNLHRLVKKLPEALAAYEASLQLKRELNDRAGEADVLMGIGAVHHELGDAEKAKSSFEAALQIVRAEKNKGLEALTLSNLGAVQERLKDYPAAVVSYEGSAKAYHDAGDKSNEARVLVNLGNVRQASKKIPEAIAAYEASLKLRQELGDKAGQADLLIGIGAVHHQQGDAKKAAASFEAALQVVRDLKNKTLEAVTLNNLGAMHERLDDLPAALAAYQESAKAYKEASDQAGEARMLANLGNVQRRQRKHSDALASYQSSLAIRRALKDDAGEVDLLMRIGATSHEQRDSQKASDSFESALQIAKKLENKPLQALIHSNLGTLFEQSDSMIPAQSAYDSALKLFQEIGDRAGEARMLVNLGNTRRSLRNLNGALEVYDKCLPIAKTLGDKDSEFRCNLGRALVFTSQGRWSEARTEYRLCMNVMDSLPVGLQSGAAGSLSLGDRKALRANLVMTALRLQTQGDVPSGEETARGKTYGEIAFADLESLRSHGFVESIVGRGISIREGAPAEQLQKERELAAKTANTQRVIALLKGQASSQDDKRIPELEQQLRTDEQALQNLIRSLQGTKYGKLRYPNAMSVAEARKVIPADGAILSYYVLPTETVLFAITKSGFSIKGIGQTKFALQQKTSQLLTALASGGKNPSMDWIQTSNDLYNILFAPASEELKGVKRLVIVPDGPLCYLPFASLVTKVGEKPNDVVYLLDDFAIATVPWLSAVEFDRAGRGKWKAGAARTVTAFADPEISSLRLKIGEGTSSGGDSQENRLSPVSHGASEVQSVAALFKPKDKVNLGVDANEQRARADSANTPLLLFATPVRLGDDSPQSAGIALTGGGGNSDGFLGPEEILNLKLNADIVVLSGAYSIPDKVTTGDALNCLAGELLYAGAESVALSLWQVNDPSRIQFSQALFTNLKTQMTAGEVDKADALRNAQLKLRKSRDFSHPFYWAAFVLSGDWN